MDRDDLTERTPIYREIVKGILREIATIKPSFGEVETEFICDDAQGHYEISYVGWDRRGRVHGSVIHIDIRNGKVWLQHDGTNLEIAQQLLDAGIPREHIVLGFQPPNVRQHTPFAVA
jgi:hypothetical protein